MIQCIRKDNIIMGIIQEAANWISGAILRFGKWLEKTLKELVAAIGRFFGKLLNWFKKAINAVEQSLAAAGLNAEVSGASTYIHKKNNGEFEEVAYNYSKQGDSYRRDTVITTVAVPLDEFPPDVIAKVNALGLDGYSDISSETSERMLQLENS